MALKRRVMVNLLEVKEIDFVGRNAEQVHKFKYTFINPEREIIHGYLDEKRVEWEDKIIDTDIFVESRAIETHWLGREWEGQTTWRLV